MAGTPTALPTFEQALFGPFTIIIQQEIERESLVPSYIDFPLLTTLRRRSSIHSIRLPDPRADARAPHHGRAYRLPQPPAVPPSTCGLAAEGQHPGTCQTAQGVFGARRPADDRCGAIGGCFGYCPATVDPVQN